MIVSQHSGSTMYKHPNKITLFQHLGQMSYAEAWDYQTELFNGIIAQKMENRKREDNNTAPLPTENYLLFCEHPPVYTLGKSGMEGNLLLNQEGLREKGIEFFRINRGGDITFHGPGQIVGYPILDLDNFFTDIHKYLRFLEEAVIRTLAEYGIQAGRIDKLTGVWLDYEQQRNPRKICALGVKTSRWVTMHGFAFNVNTNLEYFNHIVPCGIADKAVTSLANELGSPQPMQEVETKLLRHLSNLFEMELANK